MLVWFSRFLSKKMIASSANYDSLTTDSSASFSEIVEVGGLANLYLCGTLTERVNSSFSALRSNNPTRSLSSSASFTGFSILPILVFSMTFFAGVASLIRDIWGGWASKMDSFNCSFFKLCSNPSICDLRIPRMMRRSCRLSTLF